MKPTSTHIGSIRIDASTYSDASFEILKWAKSAESCYICFANVHMSMECNDSIEYASQVNGANRVYADGMPIVWTLKRRGFASAERLCGPQTMERLCIDAAEHGISVGFFGSTKSVIDAAAANLLKIAPTLNIVLKLSPPFLSAQSLDQKQYIDSINNSGAQLIFIGLGCPKQEAWMNRNSSQIRGVLLGVGAAFDFHAGTIRRAPNWIQKCGMEWAFRLALEPRRLWKRYLKHNPRFIYLLLREELSRICLKRKPQAGSIQRHAETS